MWWWPLASTLNGSNTTKTMSKNPNIPAEIAVPLMYYVDEYGKYVFDDEEMHDYLEEKVNEISLSVNRLGRDSLN